MPFLCLPRAVWNQFIKHLFEVICLYLLGHDFHHLLLDLADLLVLSIGGLAYLMVVLFSKTNREQVEQITSVVLTLT
jgi:hypothetical protein